MSYRTLKLRREIARNRTSNLNRDLRKPSATHWPNVHFLYKEWRGLCESTIRGMKVCGNCGFSSYGNNPDQNRLFTIASLEIHGIAPYAYCNAFLIPYIHISDSHYNICMACVKDRDRSKILSFMSPSYIRSILKAKPLYLQLLSLLDCRIGIMSKFNGFHSGFVHSESLLDSPLIYWNLETLQCSNIHAILKEVYEVFTTNLLVNKFFKKYLCLLETPDPSLGVCMLSADAVEDIVRNQREKGIATYSMTVNPYDPDIQILQDVSYNVPVSRKRKYDLFKSGNLYCKNALLLRDPMTTNFEGLSDTEGITLETTMFPFLFPHQHGHYQGGVTFAEYIRRRIQQLFSPFTLYKPYMLISYQLRQSIRLVSMSNTCILDKEYNTLKKLKPDLSEDEIYRLMIKQNICSSVPGSPGWHSRHLKDLMCMVKYWGLPTFFLTLTCDEVSDSRWVEIDDLEKLVKSINIASTWKDCPVECTLLFHNRVQTFLKKFILNGANGILGKVEHYIHRYECQGRNSLHSHIPIWCSKDDIDRITNEICAYIPAAYDSDRSKFIPPVNDPMAELLFQYVTSKQLHRCRDGACIRTDSESGVRYCKMGFPFEVHFDKAPSIDSRTGKWQYYRPGVEHRNVVPYHPIVLLLWGAHMNIQRVTNEAWSFYLLKYAIKCEPTGSLNINVENAKSLGLDSLSDTQLKLVSSAVMSRPISSTEAALTCLQISTVHRSSSVTIVDSSPPNRRTSLYRKASVVCIHPTQVYALRPLSLANLTFYQYFQNYEVLPDRSRKHGFVGVDFQGNYVFSTERLVRFSDFHPIYHCEQFFYNVLLKHVHFRSEGELLLKTDADWTYLHECVYRKIISVDKDIEDLICAYADDHLYSSIYKAEMVVKIKGRISPSLWEEASIGAYVGKSIPKKQTMSRSNKTSKTSNHIIRNIHFLDLDTSTSTSDLDTSTLTSDQLETFMKLKNEHHGLHLVTGSPGSGKSFFIGFMKRYWEQQGKTVLLTATTAVAAIRLDVAATTVHHAFKIPIRGAFLPLHRSNDIFDLLASSDVIVIDECSMLTPKLMTSIASRLHEVLQGNNRGRDPFTVKIIVLVGDMCQLPPVCKHETLYICNQCHLSSYPLYTKIKKYHLTTVVRQASDPKFLAFLNSIRITNPSQDAIDECLQQCYVSEEEGQSFIDQKTTIICSHRDLVAKYNTMCLLNFFPIDHIVEVPILTNAPPDDSNLQQWILDPKFHQLQYIAIGCRVLLTENIDVNNQAANGSSAEVHDLIFDENGLSAIIIKLDINHKLIKVVRSCTKYRRIRNSIAYQKSTFPIVLGYSMTGHKSQGCTLRGKVLMVLSSAFAPGLTYVMLSRITNRDNLRIMGNMPPKKGNTNVDIQFKRGDSGNPVTSEPITSALLSSCQTPEKETWTSTIFSSPNVTSPTAEEFLRMILVDIQDPEKPAEDLTYQPPSEKQINFIDFLGMEMGEWNGVTRRGMSDLINPRLEWQKIFKEMYNDFPASGLVKECLRFKNVDFDHETLTRTQSMKLFEPLTKGARLHQLRTLRYSFKVPVEILVNLTEKQASKVITRMTKERDAGGLRDIPKRNLFDGEGGSSNTIKDAPEDSPSKRSKQV